MKARSFTTRRVEEEEFGERYEMSGFVRFHVGHDAHLVFLLFGELRLHFEGAYGVDVVAEEINAEGIFRGIGVDVEDGTTYGKFARFVYVVFMYES